MLPVYYCLSVSAYGQTFQQTPLPVSTVFDLIMVQQHGTNGITTADYDMDGDQDIYVVVRDSAWGGDQRTWNRLLRRDGDLWVNRTVESRLRGLSSTRWSEMGYNIGASWGDYDNDGDPDVFLFYTGLDQLYRNNGDGTFTDVSDRAGVRGKNFQFSSHGLWWDYDNDGDLDLYVTVRNDMTDPFDDRRNRMYENVGDDRFIDVSEVSGLNINALSYMAVALDVDADRRLDLYVANDFGPNTLFLNNGNKTFRQDTLNRWGLNDRGEGMGIALEDINNDQLIDIYVTNVTNPSFIVQSNPLFIHRGDHFENVTFDAGTDYAGWGWGTSFFDMDNDTDLDLFVSTGYFDDVYENHLFRRTDTDSILFEDFRTQTDLSTRDVSRAHLIYDHNEDGALDVLVSNFYRQPDLYLNQPGQGNWLAVSLEGIRTNRSAFGSRVFVYNGEEIYMRYHHGAVFFGQNILPVHFGLGDVQSVDSLVVRWLNGGRDVIVDPPLNQTLKIRETQGVITSITEPGASAVKPFDLKLSGNFPNPFNNGTVIEFKQQQSAAYTFTVYSVSGQQIYQTNGFSRSGLNSIRWSPGALRSGMYLYEIRSATGAVARGRMIYLK